MRSLILGGALALVSACTIPFGSTPPAPAAPGPLAAGTATTSASAPLTFERLQGADWVPDEPGFASAGHSPALRFLDGDRVSGTGGCNRFSGPASVDSGSARIGPLATTRMNCAGGAMQAEARWFLALERARGARMEHGRLVLTDSAGAPLLRLVRAAPAQTGGAGADVPAPPPSDVSAGSLASAAAARGVRFLGRGNEPGWRVEIGPGDLVRVVYQYGTVRAEFPSLAARRTPDGDTVHEGVSGTHSVRVTLRPVACIDDMSGESYPFTVLLRFDGEERRGCGAPLARR